jgi:hypothetical protein
MSIPFFLAPNSYKPSLFCYDNDENDVGNERAVKYVIFKAAIPSITPALQ